MSAYIQKRNADVIFSVVATPIHIRLWNTNTFERLNRMLYSWLEGEIGDGEGLEEYNGLCPRSTNTEKCVNGWILRPTKTLVG